MQLCVCGGGGAGHVIACVGESGDDLGAVGGVIACVCVKVVMI